MHGSGGCGRATSDSSTWTLIGLRENFVIQCKDLIGYSMMMVSHELEDCLLLDNMFYPPTSWTFFHQPFSVQVMATAYL